MISWEFLWLGCWIDGCGFGFGKGWRVGVRAVGLSSWVADEKNTKKCDPGDGVPGTKSVERDMKGE